MADGQKIIINSCHTCRNPIYQGEPIYTSSKGESSGHMKGVYGGKQFGGGGYSAGAYGGNYSGNYASETWAQCAWCYDQWQTEVAVNKKFWIKWWIGGSLLIILTTIVISIVFPGLEINSANSVPWYQIKIFSLGSWKIPLITPLVLIVGLLLTRILGHFLQPKVDRYKLRKNPINIKN